MHINDILVTGGREDGEDKDGEDPWEKTALDLPFPCYQILAYFLVALVTVSFVHVVLLHLYYI